MEEMEANLGQMFVDGGTHNCRVAESEELVDVYWYKKGEVKDPLLLPLGSQSRMVKKEEVKVECDNSKGECSRARNVTGEEDWRQFELSGQHKMQDVINSVTFQIGARVKEEVTYLVTKGREVEKNIDIETSEAKKISQIEENPGNLVRNLLLRLEMDKALRNAYALHVRGASDRRDDSKYFKNDWQEFEYLRNSSGFQVNLQGKYSHPILGNGDTKVRKAEWEEREDFDRPSIHSDSDIDPLALPLGRSSTPHCVSGEYQFKEEVKGRKLELTGFFENEPRSSSNNTDDTRNKQALIKELGTQVQETVSTCNKPGSKQTSQLKIATSSEKKPAKLKRNFWMLTEKSFQRIPCDFCDEISVSWQGYVSHIRAHRNDYKCFICARGFSRQRHLNHHIKTHTGSQRRFSCPHCDKTYATRSGRSKHVATHTRLTLPYSECEKTFRSGQSLTECGNHRQRRSGFRCQICGEILKSRNTLAVHHLTHTEERPFICAVCLTCLLKAQLSGHTKNIPQLGQHVQPGICDICGKIVKNRHYLTSHLKGLAAIDTNKCPTCGKEFPTSASLKRHVRIHLKKKSDHECPVCHETFRFKKYFKSHVKNHSKMEELSS